MEESFEYTSDVWINKFNALEKRLKRLVKESKYLTNPIEQSINRNKRRQILQNMNWIYSSFIEPIYVNK